MPNTITIPETAAELEEILSDTKQVQALFAEPGKFKEFVTAYVKVTQDADVSAQIKAQVEEVMKDYAAKSSVKRLPTEGPKASGHKVLYNPEAPGAVLDDLWESTGEFLRASWYKTIAVKGFDPRLIKNDMSSIIGADGGFLIPEILRSELLQMSLETSIVRSRATVIPMNSLRVPFPAIDDQSHASTVFGGMSFSWTEESGTLAKSQPTFARVVLEASKLAGYVEVPNELLADSVISMEAFINNAYPKGLAWFEDLAFLTGNGVGQPLGSLNSLALVSVSKETNQPASTIVWENIVKMYARMLPSSLGGAVWVANIDSFPQLATMALNVGTAGSAIWLNNGVVGPPMSILGRPVLFTEKVPTTGTVGDINFMDLSYYLIGDRQAISMASSQDFKFQQDQTAYRFIERVDGRPWILSALTPHTGSNTLSPFVSLATRS